MTGQRQAAVARSNGKQRSVVMPVAVDNVVANLVGDQIGPLAEMGAPFRNGSAGQAAQLGNSSWQVAQRQTLATRIGRVQGNAHLQRLVASLRVSTEPLEEEAASPAMMVASEPPTEMPEEEAASPAMMVASEPPTEMPEEEAASPATASVAANAASGLFVLDAAEKSDPAIDLGSRQLAAPVLAPTGCENAGGCVYCDGGALKAWVNPSEPACVKPCIQKHEDKHVADFKADSVYKDKCSSTTDGHGVTYNSRADQTKFELPAIDLEIKCLKEKLKTETDTNNKKIIKKRAEVTLPAYRVACGG